MSLDDVVLEARGLTRRFTGVLALSGVDFRLRAAEVHGLMGQNGAGKSTLIKILTGVYPPDAGELRLNGEVIRPASPAAAQRLGISTVYQEVNLCPNLSVAENIFAGRYPRKGAAGAWRIDWKRMAAQSRALLARLNLEIDVTRLLSSYPVAVQQMVAIARALSVQAKVLILDEPTSSLDEQEVERLFAVLRQLRGEGMAILFVTHFLEQMYAISDRITVLRNGERVNECLAADLPPAALITAMVGRELSAAEGRNDSSAAQTGAAVLEAQGVGQRGQLNPVDVTNEHGARLLHAFIWPGRVERAQRLKAAISILRREPPTLVRGDYVELLPAVLAERDEEALTIVFQIASTGYIGRERRAELRALLERAGAEGPLGWVSTRAVEELEEDRTDSYELEVGLWPGGKRRLLLRCDFHGNWIRWRS